jgi:ABC-type branched-subunit amino acid transport system substrate-binding protein
VKSTDRKPFVNLLNKIFLPLIILFLAVAVAVVISLCTSGPNDTLKIGVLLPLTGPDSLESDELLNWLAAGINDAGGIGGTPIEIIYKDTYQADILALAHELTSDPAIQIVIGPQRSSELHKVAPLFIESKKLLISPMATSGDILRAYGKKDFIWRTCQSDIAQVRSILYELSSRNVDRISLIYSDDSYGQTFLNWTGFFCTELGIDLLNHVGYQETSKLAEVLDEALSGDPQYILTAAFAEEAVELVKLLQSKEEVETRLFFTDAAETPHTRYDHLLAVSVQNHLIH